jgi:hypothetical protein
MSPEDPKICWLYAAFDIPININKTPFLKVAAQGQTGQDKL